MAGVYYLLAQLMVINGRKFSIIRPLWYSYIFIFCDACSLVIQAAGGGLVTIKLQELESTQTGTIIMTVEVAFQVLITCVILAFILDSYLAEPSEGLSLENSLKMEEKESDYPFSTEERKLTEDSLYWSSENSTASFEAPVAGP
ncbi:hypothetical protein METBISCDRAFT_21603 [Metschnikowia bicuspidata]|uniref:Sphingoid long-chain base transporter RSB1 n=1 Tax=Metschnikowia bicuspidata TaxID=27322 RepID=A0A4P9ZH63_9ASCO|nr:hypothetical protein METBISCDRAFT_21603 [Metschnikowia bicuspidata]